MVHTVKSKKRRYTKRIANAFGEWKRQQWRRGLFPYAGGFDLSCGTGGHAEFYAASSDASWKSPAAGGMEICCLHSENGRCDTGKMGRVCTAIYVRR